ncbi:MAG: ABC-2 transporter permease [Planctomycetes bacterium]|nr:ABC-2 transporter permease [Planctomycetota bacterium]
MRTFVVLLDRELRATLQSFGFYALLALVASYTAWGYVESLELRGFQMGFALFDVHNWLFWLTMLICPLLTMRLFAEERRSGSIELLMTAPVGDLQVVLAKYVAVVVEFLLFLFPIWVIHLVLALFYDSSPDWGHLASVTLGMSSVGLVFLALGTMASALTSMQLWAALLGALANMILWSVGQMRGFFPEGDLGHRVLSYLSLDLHLQTALSGIVDLRQLVLQSTLVFLFLFWTVRIVETRKWR